MGYALHGGDIYHGKIRDDFSVNVNPLGLPPGVRQVLRESVEGWSRYPDPECGRLIRRLADYHGTSKERIVCGNGAADLIYRLAYQARPKRALVLAPSFSEYERALMSVGCRVRHFSLREEKRFQVDAEALAGFLEEGEWLFLCNPNNPTGLAVPKSQVELLAEACHKKGGLLVLDECFCEFLDRPEDYSFMERIWEYPQVVILRAFTKSYAMAGLRLGYMVCGDLVLAGRLRLTGQPWSVSLPAQEAGVAALEEKDFLKKTKRLVKTEREWMLERLAGLGFLVFPSQVNYLLFKDEGEEYHGNLWERLRERRILIRDCSNFLGLEPGEGLGRIRYYRIGLQRREKNEKLLEALSMIMKDS
ncbi:MAG: aminotransferase class I/II-fold pyridoxal phosphate-dependent enzyme [Lachnospiraceae bacterium]|jgi:threonine-phosphate decarboxylase|nr:aminotransferase class I/II-fold pyridoxal phosphate-dependent enzyme [Lachnospiraceae bacterium]